MAEVKNISLNTEIPTYLSIEDNGAAYIKTTANKVVFNSDMSGAFQNCFSLDFNPMDAVFDWSNVTNMVKCFANCSNLTSVYAPPNCAYFADFTSGATNIQKVYYNTTNIPMGAPFGWYLRDTLATDLYLMDGIYNLSGGMAPFGLQYAPPSMNVHFNCPNVTDLVYFAYGATQSFEPWCGDNVNNMSYAYFNATNVYGTAVIGNNVNSIAYAFYNCNKITNMTPIYNEECRTDFAFQNCKIKTAYFGGNMKYSVGTYNNCPIEEIYIMPYITDLSRTSQGIGNISGSSPGLIIHEIPDSVTNMWQAFYGADYLRDTVKKAACGNYVTNFNFSFAYQNKLTEGISGPNVIDMSHTYLGCNNIITGDIGPNVTNIEGCFSECQKLSNLFIYYNKKDGYETTLHPAPMMSYKTTDTMLNIHLYKDSDYDKAFYEKSGLYLCAVPAGYLTWTDMENGYYNSYYNIYVYNNFIGDKYN